MDEATLDRIRAAARQNSIDPDELLAAVNTRELPDELQDVIAAILGDIGIFGKEPGEQDK